MSDKMTREELLKRGIRCKNQDQLADVLDALGPCAVHMVMLHDDTCVNQYDHCKCDCNPEYIVEEATEENLMHGVAAARSWHKGS